VIVATAGHIDHGKTILVKALTGIDTDRLPEEKRRGLSIDLGFAYAPLDGGPVIGFVDVPGHERFVRNMIAGVAGIDFALLVVAADDGPMPQTREHLAILDLLGVTEGVVALTKIDRVSTERVPEVAAQIIDLLSGTGLADVPILPVSGITGEGMPGLRAYMDGAARQTRAPDTAGNFRLAIDRSFTVAGAGVVVTGAVFSGAVNTGDRLIISPAGIEVRVRGIHAQNRAAETGLAGQRCALNIAGARLSTADVGRGDWLLAEAIHAPTSRIDARIRVLPGEARALEHWTPVHVHLGAGELTGRVALLDGHAMAPGDHGLVQLVLDRKISALGGDRFILRDQSAWRTIAGGRVIDPFAPSRGRAGAARREILNLMEGEDTIEALNRLLDAAPLGLDLTGFARTRNLVPAEAAALWQRAGCVKIGEAPALGFARRHWDGLREAALALLRRTHADRPEAAGLAEEALGGQLFETPGRRAYQRASVAVVMRLADDLVASGEVVRAGGNLRLKEHRAEMAPIDAALWSRLEPLLDAGALRPPAVQELARELDLQAREVERFLQRAARLGLVVRVAGNRFYPPDALRRLGEMAESLGAAADDGMFSTAAFRDRSGIGRNLAIEVMEYFDKVGFTRRSDNVRRVLKPADEVRWSRAS
jgi:selenocysteine-specific elongation factor